MNQLSLMFADALSIDSVLLDSVQTASGQTTSLALSDQVFSGQALSGGLVSIQAEEKYAEPSAESTRYSFQDVDAAFVWLFALFGAWILLRGGLQRWKAAVSSSPSASDEDFPWMSRAKTKFPCGTCYYFKANRHLPCAVNPTRVMTPESVDCSDFRSKYQDPYQDFPGESSFWESSPNAATPEETGDQKTHSDLDVR